MGTHVVEKRKRQMRPKSFPLLPAVEKQPCVLPLVFFFSHNVILKFSINNSPTNQQHDVSFYPSELPASNSLAVADLVSDV